MTQGPMLGAIETGGTKIVCAVAQTPDQPQILGRFPTGGDPSAALAHAVDLMVAASKGDLVAVGVASFGPCDPRPTSPSFGHVLATPKPGWAGADVVGLLRQKLRTHEVDAAIAFDTDVNAALVGEVSHGAAQGLSDAVYLTVGTGIGAGALDAGHLVHGQLHPEMGHIRLPRQAGEVDDFAGVCPFHGDCWEGLAAGPAMRARWGSPAEELPDDHPAWDLEARYLALGLQAITYMHMPRRIVIGGGVGLVPHLLGRVRAHLSTFLNGYPDIPELSGDLSDYLVPPGLPDNSGIVGALCLAQGAAPAR